MLKVQIKLIVGDWGKYRNTGASQHFVMLSVIGRIEQFHLVARAKHIPCIRIKLLVILKFG